MVNEVGINESVISFEEINRCIAVLTQLNTDTELIFDIPKNNALLYLLLQVNCRGLIAMN
jgi:hypothetical protein